jgi:hypothetical protein
MYSTIVFWGKRRLATSQEMLIRNIYMNIGELKEIINIILALYWMILDINNKIINLELTLDCLFTKYWLYTGYLVTGNTNEREGSGRMKDWGLGGFG